MGMICFVSVFMNMNTNTDINAKKFWEVLTPEARIELLQKHNLWNGFSQYLWEYLPECLKELIVAKIASNCV
jgi:hypothetical protein